MRSEQPTGGQVIETNTQRPARRRPRRRLSDYCVIAVLVVAAILSCLSGVVATPGSMPDEDAHYAYVKHLADYYGEFPIDYGSMYVYGLEEYNSATHAPLYYYVMATAYRVLQPDRHFTAVGREKDRYASKFSRDCIVPILRAVSWFILFVSFVGIYRLARYFVRIRLLRPWFAAPAAALMCFVPELIYIGGSLNNDIAVFALWPFIVLYSTKYYLGGRWTHFWKGVFVLSAGILSKSTFWLFVLGCGALLLAGLVGHLRRRSRSGAGQVQPVESTTEASEAEADKGKARPTVRSVIVGCVWAILALAMTAAAGIHVGTNLSRYGQLHPDSGRVHAIAEGRSYLPPADAKPPSFPPRSFFEISESVARFLATATFGYVGHTEHLHPSNTRSLLTTFRLSLAAIVLALCGFFIGRPPERRIKLLVAAWWAIVIGFCTLFVYVEYQGYKSVGVITGQGRYFIGYYHLLILALFVMASEQMLKGPPLRRTGRVVLAGGGFIGLFFVLCHPFFYLRSTMENYHRAGIESMVLSDLGAQGYQDLLATRRSPNLTLGYGILVKRPYFLLTHADHMIGGEIAMPPKECGDLEVTIWARGNSLRGRDATLGVGLCDVDDGVNLHDPPSRSLCARVEVTDEMDVHHVRIPVGDWAGKRQMLFIRLLPELSGDSDLLRNLRRRGGGAAVFGVFYRFSGCQNRQVSRRPAELDWRPSGSLEIQAGVDGLRLHPTGADPQMAATFAEGQGSDQETLHIVIAADRPTVLQWFLDVGEGYSEQLSRKCPIAKGNTDVLIPLPPSVRSLRLDPDADMAVNKVELITTRWTK